MVLAGLSYLAAADPTALAAQAQAECLQTLEQADAVATAARARILAAFTAGHGYADDADYSPTSWLIHRTRITKGAARGHLGWARRAAAHPQVLAALAEGTVLTESMARLICGWTGKLPEDCRDTADGILLAAAAGRGPHRRTWPRWPRRSTPGPCPTTRTQRPAAELRGPAGAGGDAPSAGPGSSPATSPRSAPRWSPRCWMRCRPRPGRRTPGPRTSATTTRWRTRCAAWSPWSAAGAGRAAGESLGARLAGRAARPG